MVSNLLANIKRYAPNSLTESKPCPPLGGRITSREAFWPLPILVIRLTSIDAKLYPEPACVIVTDDIEPDTTITVQSAWVPLLIL